MTGHQRDPRRAECAILLGLCPAPALCFTVLGMTRGQAFPKSQDRKTAAGGFMFRLRMWQLWMATAVLTTGLSVVPSVAAGNNQTFTGKVSDAMCGAKHTEAGIAPADCVRVCVKKGAKYALVVGDKVYTLSTSDQASLDRSEEHTSELQSLRHLVC